MPELSTEQKEQEVLRALSVVQDPDLHKDIVTLGFIKNLRICGGTVAFTIELTTPACPVKNMLRDQAVEAVKAIPWVEEVKAELSAKVTSRTEQLMELQEMMKGVKNVIAIASGKGGVGKSTVAVNIALALARLGAKVGLMDADVYGPSLPILLGVHEQPEINEARKIQPIEKYGLKLMSLGFLINTDQAVIWRGPMVHSLVQQFLRDVDWGELDYLIVDLPPGTGDAQLTLTQSIPLAGAIVVTTPQAMASVIAGKVVGLFRKMNVHVLGAIENMSYFICDNCGKEHDIFDRGGGAKMCLRLGIPFLGAIPLDPRMREGDDMGRPVVLSAPDSKVAEEFMKVAGNIAAQVSIANANLEPQMAQVAKAGPGIDLKTPHD